MFNGAVQGVSAMEINSFFIWFSYAIIVTVIGFFIFVDDPDA